MSIRLLLDDGNQIKVGTGIGKYSLYLYEALMRQGCNIELVEPNIKGSTSRVIERLKYIKSINCSKYLKHIDTNFDAVIYSNYLVPFRKAHKAKYIVTIHDMVSFLYPDTLPKFYRMYCRMAIRNSIRKADLIMTVSESVKKEILSFFPEAKNKIKYTWEGIYDGIKPLDFYDPYSNEYLCNIDEFPFFLFISTVEKRKNVGMVLDAFIKLKETIPNAALYKMVIVGRPGYGYEDFVKQAKGSAYANDIIFAGYTTDEDCNRLYNHARAFVFPTVYEGFGFAQIECMKCHLPIILSNISTNREISRDYGIYFELDNLQTLVKGMTDIVLDNYDKAYLNDLADTYIKDFDWDKIAQTYLEYINGIV